MAKTEVTSTQIKDGTVNRDDLNTTTAGKAVVAKIIQGSGISISSTGADAGTGDVTISKGTDTTLQTLKVHSNFTGSEAKHTTAALQTTDASTQNLFTVNISSNAALRFRIDLHARLESNTTRKVYWASIVGCASYVNSVAQFDGTPLQFEDADSGVAYTATVDLSSNTLRVRVTGAASENVDWVADIYYQEVLTSS